MKDILKSIIVEFQQRELPELHARNIQINADLPIIVTLIGARRSGKTYLMYQVVQQIIANGVSRENIVFVNFEDERLTLQTNQLDSILQAYSELYPEKKLSECYFFFDEIQNIKDWEKFVRRIFDNYSTHVFVTGSNAKLLSTEIADSLRGRTITYTVYPLSYREFLQFKGIEYDSIHPQKKALVINNTLQFIQNGSFPELIHFENDSRIKVLQSYFNTMIFRDIVERYKINDVSVLKYFIKKLFASVGKPVSINKIYNDLRSMGYKIGNNSLYEFEQYCYSVFLGIQVSKFDFSEIKQAKSDKKIYAIDTGLLSAIEFSTSENRGKLLENAVCLELFRAGFEVFYYKAIYECDFIVLDRSGIMAIQVCWQLEDTTTLNREIRALMDVCNKLKVYKAIIISFDQKQIIKINDFEVQVIPFYEWAYDLKFEEKPHS